MSCITILCSTWLMVASCPCLESRHGLVTRRNGSLGRQAGWASQHPGSVPPEGAAGCVQPGQSSPVTRKPLPEVFGVPVGRPGCTLDNPDSRRSGPETLVPSAELVVLCQVQQAVPTEAAAFSQEAKHPFAGDCLQVWSRCRRCAKHRRCSPAAAWPHPGGHQSAKAPRYSLRIAGWFMATAREPAHFASAGQPCPCRRSWTPWWTNREGGSLSVCLTG